MKTKNKIHLQNKILKFKVTLVLFAIGCLLIDFRSTQASIRTVNNAGGAQYNSLDLAVAASSVNDTLMVAGSSLQYALSSGNWNKNLVVIGTGFNSDKQVFKEVKFGPSTFYLSTSSKFIGIRFTYNINFQASVSNLSFESCRFDGDVWPSTYTLSNVSFFNCVFAAGGSNFLINNANVYSIYFSHCIFGGYITGSNNSLNFGVSADHCVFLKDGTCFVNVYNMVITNSIFYGTNPISDIYNSAFTNCISRTDVSGNWSTSGNIATSCLDLTDPLFINVPVSTLYSTTMNFHLQNGSLASNADTNGSDIGLHDNSSTFDEAGEAQNIPVIRKMTLLNNNIPQNGNLNVNVRSTKSR